MKVQVETITPAMAAELLSRNNRNRTFKRRNVEFFSREIESGNWKLNAETIKVGRDGVLLDGQHRLQAVVETGVPIQCLLATDIDPDVFDTIDTGAARSTGDTLTVAGETNGRNLAAALVLADNISKGDTSFSNSSRTSNAEILDKLERHKNIRSSMPWSRKLGRLSPVSISTAMHYLFSCDDQEAADLFFSKLSEGANLKSRDPVLLLRNRLLDNAMAKGKLTRRYVVALFIKAWNAHLAGETMIYLRFREAGDSPEKFPEISGLKEGRK